MSIENLDLRHPKLARNTPHYLVFCATDGCLRDIRPMITGPLLITNQAAQIKAFNRDVFDLAITFDEIPYRSDATGWATDHDQKTHDGNGRILIVQTNQPLLDTMAGVRYYLTQA